MNNLDQFKRTFITESFELLSDLEERLLSIDIAHPDSETLNAIFRCAHSIKGGSGAFGFDGITDFTHVMEALLEAIREGRIAITREIVNLLLQSADILTRMVQSAERGVTPSAELGSEVKLKLEAFIRAPALPAQSAELAVPTRQRSLWKIHFQPHENLFMTGNEPLLILNELATLGDLDISADLSRIPDIDSIDPTSCMIGWTIRLNSDATETQIHEVFEFVADNCDLTIADAAAEPSQPASNGNKAGLTAQSGEEPAAKAVTTTSSIRVDLEKVDRLVNMVGELVITEAMLRAQVRHLPVEQFADLIRGVDELSQHTRELQEAVMSVRMQPVKSIFSRMPRIVHDISAQLGKDIRLVMSGENTEIDKTIIEQLADPLTHMIRNSCDHGIEAPAQRLQAGKPPEGTIHLSALHRGGRIIIEISDDGAGINRAKVLAKAREKKLIAADAEPSLEEIDNFIFMAGFSTAETVSNLSGRGVGMDVVKRNITSMGGTVQLCNTPSEGTLFTVSLPLTLAILDGMIVRVGQEFYIIPITSIIESLRPKPEEVHRVEGHNDVISVRGEFIPVLYLHRLFKIERAQHDPSKALVVLVESGQHKMGLVVDELIGEQQVVIKSLEANADPVRGISGATILGDGRVSLILEINELTTLYQSGAGQPGLERAA